MAESKAAFRRRLGRVLRIYQEAETDGSGSTTSLTCTPLIDFYPADDTLAGSAIYDRDNAEWRVVDTWTASTGVATFTRAFSESMGTGREIEVYNQFSPTDLDDSIRMALDEAYAYIVIDILDDSIEVEEDVYEYPIPEIFRDFSRMSGAKVTYSHDENVETYPRFEIPDWSVKTIGESLTLVLPNISGLIGKTLHLTGKGVPTYPSTDGSLLPFRSDTLQLLAFKAAEIAWRTGPALSGQDAEFAAQQELKWGAKFEEKRDEWGTPLYPERWKDPNDTPYIDLPLAYNHRMPG